MTLEIGCPGPIAGSGATGAATEIGSLARRITGQTVLLALVILGIAAIAFQSILVTARATAEHEITVAAEVISGFLSTRLRDVDDIRRHVAEETALDAGRLGSDTVRWHERIAGLRSIIVADAVGMVVADLRPGAPALGKDVSDRRYFTAQRDRTADGDYLGGPEAMPINGCMTVPVSTPVRAADGALRAVVVSLVDLDFIDAALAGDLMAGTPFRLEIYGRSASGGRDLYFVGERAPSLATRWNTVSSLDLGYHGLTMDIAVASWFVPAAAWPAGIAITVVLAGALAAVFMGHVAQRRALGLVTVRDADVVAQASLLSAVISNSPIGILRLAGNGTITFANRRAAHVLGLPSDGDRLPDAPTPPIRAALAALGTSDSVDGVEIELAAPDGTPRHLSIGVARLLAASGQVRELLCTVEDVTERVRARREIELAASRLRDAVDSMDAELLLTDAEMRVIALNASWRSRLDAAGASWRLGMPLRELLHEAVDRFRPVGIGDDPHAWADRRYGEILDGHGPREIAFPDGCHLMTVARRTSEGGVVLLRTDVTDLRRAESALRLRTQAIEMADFGIVITADERDDHRIVYANTAFAALTGYAADEVVGHNCRFLASPETEPEELDRLRGALERRQGCRVRITNRRKDGTTFLNEILVSPVRDDDGDAAHFVGILRDVTGTAGAEAREAEQRARFAAIFDHIPDAMILAGPDACPQVLASNPAFTRLFGVAPADVPERSVPSLLEPLVEAGTLAGIRAVLDAAGRTAPPRILDYRRPNGRIFRGETEAVPVRDDAGADRGVLLVIRDVTEREEMQQQFQQAQRLDAVGRLTGGVAHDFNNLLTIVIGNLDLARRLVGRERRTDDLPALIDDALDAGRHGGDLTRRLLDFARKSPIHVEPVDLARLLEETRPLVERTLGADVAIDVQIPSMPVVVDADRSGLESAIVNLAMNAREAVAEGGHVRIRVGGTPLDGRIALIVEDDGCGMTDAVRRRAFEPFFTTKEVGKGSGLGLSVVYGFLRRIGGDIEIDTAPACGTTVTLWLPRSADAAAARAVPPPAAVTGLRILLIEDNGKVADATRRLIERLGHSAVVVGSIDAALETLASGEAIDLVISDIRLPEERQGTWMATHLAGVSPRIPVLLITGYAEDVTTHRDDLLVLRKPFDRKRLAEAIATAMARLATIAGDKT